MTDTRARTQPTVRRARRYLTAPVVAVLAFVAGLTFLFLGAYFAAGGPLGLPVVMALGGAATVAAAVAAALIFAAPEEES